MSGSNAILTEEEIEAALSAIEADALDQIPSLDDGMSSGDEPPIEPPPAPASPIVEDSTAPGPEEPVTQDAAAIESEPQPMATEPEPASRFAVEPTHAQMAEPEPRPEPESESPTAGEPRPGLFARCLAWRPRLHLQWPWRKKSGPTAVDASTDTVDDTKVDEPAAPKPPAGPWWTPFAKLGHHLVDLLDAPGRILSPAVRNTIGLVGLVTLMVSLLALIAGPIITHRNAAVAFLAEKRAALDSPHETPE